MSNRGPDSAGIAIYNKHVAGQTKVTIQSNNPEKHFAGLEENLCNVTGSAVSMSVRDTHAVLSLSSKKIESAILELQTLEPAVRVIGFGESIEIYKEVGLPETVVKRFGIENMHGSHGIGHTRMATESAVTTVGAHPFNTGMDQCLVHNGSLSNHSSLRRKLLREGVRIETENDTEVAAAYLTWKLQNGSNLGSALEDSLTDLDGFFTFVVGTKDGFGVVRDPIACKPAVMAETNSYVAFGSEYRALVNLPNIDKARVWEPEPATVYFWNH
jgi:amidophosphoribosyltransferase